MQKALGVEVSLFQGEEFAQREPRLQYEAYGLLPLAPRRGSWMSIKWFPF